MIKNICRYKKWIVVLSIIVLLSGCLQQGSVQGKELSNEKDIFTPAQTQSVKTITIERISDEMDMLNSKGWGELSGELGRTKTTTLLWYHIKKNYNLETKIVFGNPNKLDSSIAILASIGGESTLPKINIKGDEYYIINPSTPGIIPEFKFGSVYDDPRSANNYLQGYFGLKKPDHDLIEQWMAKSGVTVTYSDFTTD
ncbi:MAG: hypothetical protein Q7J35_02055 [Candidatus Methanoperedens sp.]|nr:hypothetical protein [Candidatus Methanoperedens sp.]